MANAATDTPRGAVMDMESCPTESTEAEAVPTRKRIRAGVAASITGANIPVRSSPLSADEEKRLERIRADHRSGWMQSATDVEFLLEVVKRCGL